MTKRGKSRCQICSYVEEAEEFKYVNKKYWINYFFIVIQKVLFM